MNEIGRRTRGLERVSASQPRSFAEVFGEGKKPRAFFAPGRVNLMGEHVDYNGGPVLPMAIDHGTWVQVRRTAEPRLFLASSREPTIQQLDMRDLPSIPERSWSDYPVGVLRTLRSEGYRLCGGFEMLFGGNLPVGAGLSSSASLCVVTALAIDVMGNLGLDPLARARVALRSEREFVGVPCGIMDPYSISLARHGSLLWLDCKDESFAHLPIDFDSVGVAVADTGLRRALVEGGYMQRVDECRRAFEILARHQVESECLRDIAPDTLARAAGQLGELERRRAEHVISEVSRTFRARAALESGRLDDFGQCMFETHASLRDRFEVSCPELDQLVEDAQSVDGVLGSRMTGAGFGGCTVILHRRGVEQELETRLRDGFRRRFQREALLWFFDGDAGPRELVGIQ